MDPLFHEFSIQGHCLLPFNFDFNSKEANNFDFNSKEAKNEKPKSTMALKEVTLLILFFETNRCPLLTLMWVKLS